MLDMRGPRVPSNRARSGVGRLVGSGTRRAVSVVAAAILVGLLVVPDAFARAGGGSSSFGRGGGGVGRGFGHGHFFFIPVGGGGGLLLFILVLVVVLGAAGCWWWRVSRAPGWSRAGGWLRVSDGLTCGRRGGARGTRPFAPKHVRSQAATFVDIRRLDADDRVRLRGLVAPELWPVGAAPG